MGHLAAPTMAGCRLTWPDGCRRWLPVWLPGSANAGDGRALRLITAGQVIGTVQVTHRRQQSHGGPADETIRSGIDGTDYLIDLSGRGRIPASIVQRCQNRLGRRRRRPGASLARTKSPGGHSTPRGREGRPRPHMPMTVRPTAEGASKPGEGEACRQQPLCGRGTRVTSVQGGADPRCPLASPPPRGRRGSRTPGSHQRLTTSWLSPSAARRCRQPSAQASGRL